jgi:hypothetical protein
MDTIWTVEKVKDELPEVLVIWGSDIFVGRVYGRKNQFATVQIAVDGWPSGIRAEFAWETIVHSLSTGERLIF